jgi:hypothetical protein
MQMGSHQGFLKKQSLLRTLASAHYRLVRGLGPFDLKMEALQIVIPGEVISSQIVRSAAHVAGKSALHLFFLALAIT